MGGRGPSKPSSRRRLYCRPDLERVGSRRPTRRRRDARSSRFRRRGYQEDELWRSRRPKLNKQATSSSPSSRVNRWFRRIGRPSHSRSWSRWSRRRKQTQLDPSSELRLHHSLRIPSPTLRPSSSNLSRFSSLLQTSLPYFRPNRQPLLHPLPSSPLSQHEHSSLRSRRLAQPNPSQARRTHSSRLPSRVGSPVNSLNLEREESFRNLA